MCVCVYVLYIYIKIHIYMHISTRKCKIHVVRNAILFTLHFSQIVANFPHSSGKVLQVQDGISGEGRAVLMHSQILGGI